MTDGTKEYYCVKHPSQRLSVLSSKSFFSPEKVEHVYLSRCAACADEAKQEGKAETRNEMSADVRRLETRVEELTKETEKTREQIMDDVIEEGNIAETER